MARNVLYLLNARIVDLIHIWYVKFLFNFIFFPYVRFIPRLRKCHLSTNNIQNPEKRTVLNCVRPQSYTDWTWYEPRGQSDSVGRVWPGQPQGVVLVKLAQVNLTDDHSAVSSVAVTDKQALIYCGSAAVLCRNSFTSWLAVVGTEHIWGFTWICCFTRSSNKIKLSPCTSPPSEANTAFATVITRADHWPLCTDHFVPTYSIVYILITNLMHWLLFIRKILFSSKCFEHQVLIFRRT